MCSVYQNHLKVSLIQRLLGADGAFLRTWTNNLHFSDFPGDADADAAGLQTIQQDLGQCVSFRVVSL